MVEALNTPTDLADIPLVVGVTSHRNLAASEIEPIRQLVRDFFAWLKHEFPELPLVVLSALAEGGDQLVAREALAAGARLIAPLPLAQESYAEDFVDAASRAAFNDFCQRAEVVQLPLVRGNTPASVVVRGEARDRQYAQAGVFVASHSHILLTLWDGRESDLLGGTAQVVRYALHGVMPGLIERRRGAHATLDSIDESIAYHIVCSRTDANGTLQPPLDSLAPLQTRWISQTQACAATAGMPDEFHRMFVRMQEFNHDQHTFVDEIRSSTTIFRNIVDAASDGSLEKLFSAADGLAIHFQRRVLWAMRGTHILAALTGIAFVCYSDLPSDLPFQFYGIYVFITLFGAGALLAWLARRRDWHRKYIDYRALAEGLRVQHWWRRAGIVEAGSSAFAYDNFLRKQDIELGWIRNVMRAASLDGDDGTPASDAALATVIGDWVGAPGRGGQLDYYARKTEHRGRMQRLTRRLGLVCLWTGLSIGALLALFQSRLGPDNTTLLVAVMGVLAIIAAARESYAYRKGDKELSKQYRYMFDIFANARAKLDAANAAVDKREILRELGEAALAEHSEWALMHRERPLESARF
ncbi:MAG TPA: hypothetical protein VIC31_05635 [Rudaea sp.]|jgi:hypothetical protein